jgi:hypothetical protein
MKDYSASEFFYDNSFKDYYTDEDFVKAIEVFCEFLNKEPDLYQAYQANIAIQFKDEIAKSLPFSIRSNYHNEIHHAANKAAMNFLDLLISQVLQQWPVRDVEPLNVEAPPPPPEPPLDRILNF